MKLIAIFCLLTFSILSFAKTGDSTTLVDKEKLEKQRWNHILKLINEEITTINMARKKSQKLMYRLFELKSEKIKLFKEKENKEFVAKKLKYGKKIKRKEAFSETLALYNDANDFGKKLLKTYPRTSYKAAIYYTLALNARDFAYDKKELGYLLKSIKYSGGQKQVNYLATTSLAEYYYNNKKYELAVKNYEKIIGNRDDEWLTKNLYNYGWCLLKTHKFDDAINRLEEGYTLSPDEFYIDMSEQIMSSLVSFYVYGKQIDRGVAFIKKNATNKNESLLKLAQKASGKGFFKETEEIIADLENKIKPDTTPVLYTEMRLFQFDLYTQYHKSEKLLIIGKMLPILKMDAYQTEETVRKVSEVVGARQIILKKDFSKHDQSYDKSTLNEVVTYFDILSKINTPEKAQYEYFKGETYYSVNRFTEALSSYKSSLINYDKVKSKNDLRAQSMDAIFSSIDLIKFNKKNKKAELDFAYNKYLSYWPGDDKARDIYPRLFALHFSTKTFPKMQDAIDRYIANFPKDNDKQKDLYRTFMDDLIKTKNTQLLSSKIIKIKQGYLGFDPIEVKKSETILATILFSTFQDLNKAGKQTEALEGYRLVHFTEFYPKSVKAEAAFNMGVIYTDLLDHNNALKWYEKSFTFYTDKEKLEKRDYLEKMALRTELLHDFLYSAKISKFIVSSFCSDKKENQDIFEKSIKNDLANDYISKVFHNLESNLKCVKSFSKDLKKEVLVHLYENKHEGDFKSFIDNYKIKNLFRDEVSHFYEKLFWKYYRSNPKKEKLYLYELKNIKYDDKSKLLVKALKAYEQFSEDVKNFQRIPIATSQIKDPGVFSKKLQSRLGKLQPLIKSTDSIFEFGHGEVSVLVFDKLSELTNSLASEIESYRLNIDDNDFQKQFKNQMAALAKNIQRENNNYKVKSQDLVEKYELLITQRDQTHPARDIIDVTDIRRPASLNAITFGLGI